MIKVVNSRKAKIHVGVYIEQLMNNPNNKNNINPANVDKYTSIAKRELKKQQGK